MADVKIMQGALRTGLKGNMGTLSQALAEQALCGCGIECECYGYLVLPDWNSTTGARTEGSAIYIVDGVATVATVTAAKAAIDGYKALQ